MASHTGLDPKLRRRPTTVGLVGPLPPPSGGMANQTQQLARLLEAAGLNVELVQVNSPYRPAWIHRVRGVRALFRALPYLGRLWTCAGRVDLFHVMANSGWAWHFFAAPAVWIARVRGIPAIVNYRGGEAERFLDHQIRWVRPTLSRAFAVIVPSGFLEGVFARFVVRTEIVPNIVDLSRFAPGRSRPRGRHAIVTRNLEALYDIPTAIRAFARIRAAYPDARLTIAGEGPALPECQACAAEFGVETSVHFIGRLDNERVAALYREADLLLNPSTADNMPISLLEAMASGLPIVSTNVGGISFLVEDGRSALLVPPRDADAMAAAALKLFADEELAKALATRGLELARRYAWSQVRPKLFAVYARALGLPSLTACAT